jgi:hypothetical protein
MTLRCNEIFLCLRLQIVIFERGAMDARLGMAGLEKPHAAKQRPDRRPLSRLRDTLSLKSVPAAGTPTAAPRLARSADERARERRPN